jgi:hypothetical protein
MSICDPTIKEIVQNNSPSNNSSKKVGHDCIFILNLTRTYSVSQDPSLNTSENLNNFICLSSHVLSILKERSLFPDNSFELSLSYTCLSIPSEQRHFHHDLSFSRPFCLSLSRCDFNRTVFKKTRPRFDAAMRRACYCSWY